MVFLLRYVKAALRSGDEMFIETCQYLLDSFIVRLEYSCIVPSLRAAASVLAALSLFSSLVVDQVMPVTTLVSSPTTDLENEKIRKSIFRAIFRFMMIEREV